MTEGKCGIDAGRAPTLLAGLLAAAVAAVPVPVAAQNSDNLYGGGSRLPRREAQITQSGPTAARRVMQQFGECVYNRGRGRAQRLMDTPVGTSEYDRLFNGIFDSLGDSCLNGNGTLRFDDTVMRGSIFQAAYKVNYGRTPPAALRPFSRAELASRYDGPLNESAARHLLLQEFGACVAMAKPTEVRALVLAGPETVAEVAALAALSPVYAGCLPANAKIAFSKEALKATLSEALYRVSSPAPTPQPAVK